MIGLVAHGLKGILALAVINAYMIRDSYLGLVNFKQRKAMDSFTRNLDYLDATVKKSLSLRRIERGKLCVNKSPLSFKKDVFETSILALAPMAVKKDLHLANEVDADWLREVVAQIKSSLDVPATLCVGERSRREYRSWKEAGADRYLLKIETSDPDLYGRLHPGMSFENRTRCLRDLAELGYQTGSGNLVGLRGQTLGHLADDIRFFRQGDFDMIGVSPFIPHPQTPLAAEPTGDLWMTLKMTALTRIVSRQAHIPATTALGSLHGRDERPRALVAGANVLMPNFTPAPYRRDYEIYPNKGCVSEDAGLCPAWVEQMVAGVGRWVDYSRGDRLKTAGCAPHTINL